MPRRQRVEAEGQIPAALALLPARSTMVTRMGAKASVVLETAVEPVIVNGVQIRSGVIAISIVRYPVAGQVFQSDD